MLWSVYVTESHGEDESSGALQRVTMKLLGVHLVIKIDTIHE